jgi:site-specific recombinase XerC
VETVLTEIVTKDAKRIRDLALLALVWHDQLTTGQLCQLNLGDVDLAAGCAQVQLRGKRRTLFLARETLPYLQRWLAVRRLYQPLTNALFISLHWTTGRSQPHERLSPRGVFAIRAAYSRRVG